MHDTIERKVEGQGADLMDKVWLKNYSRDVPTTIEMDKFSSLLDLMETSCAKYADQNAYINMGAKLTYKELDEKSRDLAAFFTEGLGLTQGDRIAIMMPNLIQYPIAMMAAFRAGLIVVNVNPLYTPRELKHQLNDSGSKAIIILENVAHVLAEIINETEVKHVISSKIGDSLGTKGHLVNFVVKYVKKMCPPWKIEGSLCWKKVLAKGNKLPFTKKQLSPDDIAFIQYTGGTTGLSKGAVLTHRNMTSNVEQAYQWIKSVVSEGQETIITALPLYHVFSLTANCLTFLLLGAKNVLITNPRDIPNFVKELSKHPFTIMTGVNTLFNALLHNEAFSKLDFSNLKIVLGGGMAVQRTVAEKWQALTNAPLAEAYGLTETSPAAVINPVNIQGYNGSIGLPIPSTEAKIIDDDGNTLDFEEVGELCIRGPQVMRGYWNRPEETAAVLSDDGWFKTGDIAKMDRKGYLYIVDRKKDLILVSGFNVYPNEVEDVIAAHPGVVEVAAVGIPDAHSGELVKVFVVKSDAALSEADIVSYAKKNLTPYKVPKMVEFRDELPKTNVGKILRRALRDEVPQAQ